MKNLLKMITPSKKDRLERLINHYSNGKKSHFANLLNVTPQTISTWLTRDTYDTELIYSKCVDVSASWLISGEGGMLKEDRDSKDKVMIGSNCLPDYINSEVRIPLVNQHAVAGFGNSNFSIQAQDVKEYYVVPKFKYSKVDFMIEIYGDSMTPRYNSGDVIACTILKNRNYIQWNRAHIIATEDQGILCKRIKPSDRDGYITAVSDNPDYPPFDIPCNEVTGIALIVGVIRAD